MQLQKIAPLRNFQEFAAITVTWFNGFRILIYSDFEKSGTLKLLQNLKCNNFRSTGMVFKDLGVVGGRIAAELLLRARPVPQAVFAGVRRHCAPFESFPGSLPAVAAAVLGNLPCPSLVFSTTARKTSKIPRILLTVRALKKPENKQKTLKGPRKFPGRKTPWSLVSSTTARKTSRMPRNLLTVRTLKNPVKLRPEESRKGGFSKGGFCRVECHTQGSKKTQKDWAQQCIWHSERRSQERRIFFQKPPSKKPLFLVPEKQAEIRGKLKGKN